MQMIPHGGGELMEVRMDNKKGSALNGIDPVLTEIQKRLQIREPDAGNPPVRFDEREVETEQGGIVWHRQPKGPATRMAHLNRRATSDRKSTRLNSSHLG